MSKTSNIPKTTFVFQPDKPSVKDNIKDFLTNSFNRTFSKDQLNGSKRGKVILDFIVQGSWQF